MTRKNSRDRNSPHLDPGQLRDGRPQIPTFVRNEEFAAGIARLARAYEVMNAGSPTGWCNFQPEGDMPCTRRPVGNHSIQEKILDRLAVRGHVKTFPRDIRNLKNRFIDEDPERRDLLTAQGRWAPVDIGVNEASVWRFFCDFHDNHVFRPIERTEPDQQRTRPYALARIRHSEIAKGLDRAKQLFDEYYRS